MKFPPWGVGLTSNQRVAGYPVTAVCLLYHWAHLPGLLLLAWVLPPGFLVKLKSLILVWQAVHSWSLSSPTGPLLKASICGQRNRAPSNYMPCQRQMVKLSFEPGLWQAQAYDRLCVIVLNWSSKMRGQKESAKVRKSFSFSWSMLTVQLNQIMATCSAP